MDVAVLLKNATPIKDLIFYAELRILWFMWLNVKYDIKESIE